MNNHEAFISREAGLGRSQWVATCDSCDFMQWGLTRRAARAVAREHSAGVQRSTDAGWAEAYVVAAGPTTRKFSEVKEVILANIDSAGDYGAALEYYNKLSISERLLIGPHLLHAHRRSLVEYEALLEFRKSFEIASPEWSALTTALNLMRDA